MNTGAATILTYPQSNAHLKEGFAALAHILALILGPVSGQVVSTSLSRPSLAITSDHQKGRTKT